MIAALAGSVRVRRDWKRVERKIAALIGGVRVPVTGRSRGDTPDIAHPTWSVEVKTWKRLPATVVHAWTQAKLAARGEQIPIVILHERGQRYDQAFVVMRLRDWIGRPVSEAEVDEGAG